MLLKLHRLLRLLLQLLTEGLHLLLALAQQRPLLACGLACPGQFPRQQLAPFMLLLQRQPHHRRQVLPGVHLIGGEVQLGLRRHPFAGRLVDVSRGERQQADQQEVANDDQDGAVHVGETKRGATAAARGSAGAASASSSSVRRSGRRWKILNTDTKMMPNDVEE